MSVAGTGSSRELVLRLARVVLARPRMQRLARLLFDISLRGLGILNYHSPEESGEGHFLRRLSDAWASGAVAGDRPVVLDVGANVGDYAVRVLDVLPSADVHLFEPHPRSASWLHERFGNGVTVVAAAAGSVAGTLELYDYAGGAGSSHASVYAEVFVELHRRPAEPVSVPVVRIDDYVRDAGLADVLLLKIDTEGHELEVVKGALESLGSGRIHCVQFEFNEMNLVSRVFLRDFAQLLEGYTLHRLLPRGLARLDVTPTDEIFAFQNVVAVRRGSPLERLLGL